MTAKVRWSIAHISDNKYHFTCNHLHTILTSFFVFTQTFWSFCFFFFIWPAVKVDNKMCASLKCANLEIPKPKLLQGMATIPSLYSWQGRSFQIHQLVQYFMYCRSIQDICQLGSLWYLNIQSRKLSLFLIIWKSLPSTLCHYFYVIVVLSNYITYNCVLVNCIMRNVFHLVGKGYVSVDLQSLSLTKRKTVAKALFGLLLM